MNLTPLTIKHPSNLILFLINRLGMAFQISLNVNKVNAKYGQLITEIKEKKI